MRATSCLLLLAWLGTGAGCTYAVDDGGVTRAASASPTAGTRSCGPPPLAVALLLAGSPEFGASDLGQLRAAARAVSARLPDDALFEVIVMASPMRRVVKLQAARNRTRIEKAIEGVTSLSDLDVMVALSEALGDLSMVASSRKHLLFLAAGTAPAGTVDALAQELRTERVTTTVVGFAHEAHASPWRRLAELSFGRWISVSATHAIPAVFQAEAASLAKLAFDDAER